MRVALKADGTLEKFLITNNLKYIFKIFSVQNHLFDKFMYSASTKNQIYNIFLWISAIIFNKNKFDFKLSTEYTTQLK